MSSSRKCAGRLAQQQQCSCLSHSCPLLKPFGGSRCLFASTLVGPMTYCARWGIGGPWPPWEREISGSNPQPLQRNHRCYAATWHIINKELSGFATAISPVAKLLWSLSSLLTERECCSFRVVSMSSRLRCECRIRLVQRLGRTSLITWTNTSRMKSNRSAYANC